MEFSMVDGMVRYWRYGLGGMVLLMSVDALAVMNNTPVTQPNGVANPTKTSGVNPFAPTTDMIAKSNVKPLVIHENQLLSESIKSWVNGSGYKLFWNSKKDFVVYSAITINGNSDDEIFQALGELFFAENYGLVVKNYQKNRVIVNDEM
jgi:Toxin co-regulated pilus biosynthesis protein Q.